MFYTLTNTICYHSNKLNVHYLHYIGSQDLQITSSLRGRKRKIIVTGSHFQTTLYHTGISSHGDISTPQAGVQRVTSQGRVGTHHTLRSGKGNFTLPSRNVTKPKTMAIKFQSSSQALSPQGLIRKAQARAPAPVLHAHNGLQCPWPWEVVFFLQRGTQPS